MAKILVDNIKNAGLKVLSPLIGKNAPLTCQHCHSSWEVEASDVVTYKHGEEYDKTKARTTGLFGMGSSFYTVRRTLEFSVNCPVCGWKVAIGTVPNGEWHEERVSEY